MIESKYLHSRSLLFVPAGKLDKWDKAVSSGADILCIDLEDSVPPAKKSDSRNVVFNFLENGNLKHPFVILRINGPNTDEGNLDLDMIRELEHPVNGLMIPKIDDASLLETVGKQLIMFGKKTFLFPLIESSRAILYVRSILTRNLVAGAVFGGHDLAMELGCSKEWDVLSAYRSQMILGAGGLGLTLLDMPWFGLDDEEGLRRESVQAKSFGFTGKTAIHPGQISTIHSVFTPTEQEIDEAEEMIRLFEENEGHATVWKGTILEPPVIERAKKLLKKARAFERVGH